MGQGTPEPEPGESVLLRGGVNTPFVCLSQAGLQCSDALSHPLGSELLCGCVVHLCHGEQTLRRRGPVLRDGEQASCGRLHGQWTLRDDLKGRLVRLGGHDSWNVERIRRVECVWVSGSMRVFVHLQRSAAARQPHNSIYVVRRWLPKLACATPLIDRTLWRFRWFLVSFGNDL